MGAGQPKGYPHTPRQKRSSLPSPRVDFRAAVRLPEQARLRVHNHRQDRLHPRLTAASVHSVRPHGRRTRAPDEQTVHPASGRQEPVERTDPPGTGRSWIPAPRSHTKPSMPPSQRWPRSGAMPRPAGGYRHAPIGARPAGSGISRHMARQPFRPGCETEPTDGTTHDRTRASSGPCSSRRHA